MTTQPERIPVAAASLVMATAEWRFIPFWGKPVSQDQKGKQCGEDTEDQDCNYA